MVKKKNKNKKNQFAANPPQKGSDSTYLFLLIIVLFSILLYSNTFNHSFVMDDGAMITDNKTVLKGIDGITDLWKQSTAFGSTGERYGAYRPLTMTLFAAEYSLWGKNNVLFHFIHVLSYSILCCILFLFLKKILQKFNPLLPFLTTLIFIAHPVHTEVAANIKSMDEIISMSLSLLSAWCLLLYYEKGNISYGITGWSLFFLSLFAKENSVSFLLIIPLVLFYFGTRETDWKKTALISIPNFIAVVIFLFIRSQILDEIPPKPQIINNTLAGAITFGERISTIFYYQLYNIKLLLLPHPLSWDYGYNQLPLKKFSDLQVIISILIFSFFIVYAFVSVHKKNIFSFFIFFYLITLVASSNLIVLIAATIAERFLFLPSLSFCFLLAAGILFIAKGKLNSSAPSGNKYVLLLLTICIISIYSIKTFSRNPDWKDNFTLFSSGVKTSPDSYRTNSAFAYECIKKSERESDTVQKNILAKLSIQHFKKALSIYSQNPSDWFNLGVAYNNLPKKDSAEISLLAAYRLDSNNISRSYSLAIFYKGIEDRKKSLKYFLRTKSIDSNYDDVDFEIALNFHYLQDFPNAITYYEESLKKKPGYKDALNNILVIYKSIGNREKIEYYSKLINTVSDAKK